MKITKKYALGISGIVLVGTMALGSVASAAGNDDGGLGGRRGNRPHLTAEQKCEYQDQIAERVNKVQQRLTDRLASLNERRSEADAAGDTELVTQLDQRISRLETVQERVETRYGKYQTWVSEHC
ncbi:MAG: hypothetical protein HY828_19510 [Actinobacteria bacterium]|nr:hypothetical protein [Actinomycetota bacterium]